MCFQFMQTMIATRVTLIIHPECRKVKIGFINITVSTHSIFKNMSGKIH